MMKAAIIEDEKSIIDAIRVAFEFRWPDTQIVSATSGKEGVALIRKESPDVVILDINLPDISGFEVLKKIREFSAVPVIILTVRSEDEDVLKGLETGADDYIIKPFNYLTLLSRIKAVLRRSEKLPLTGSTVTSIGSSLKIDFVDQKVWVNNQLIKLTPIEYRLLVLLVKNKDTVIPYNQIIEEIWEQHSTEDTENLRICIRRLRKKLHDIPPRMILNKRGTGYMFKS